MPLKREPMLKSLFTENSPKTKETTICQPQLTNKPCSLEENSWNITTCHSTKIANKLKSQNLGNPQNPFSCQPVSF